MTGLITSSAVLALTTKRLERIERLLRGKLNAPGVRRRETERQVLALTRLALAALKTPPSPTVSFDSGSFAPWLARDLSQFAVLGALGPEITRYAAEHAPGQEWLINTWRTGNPDPDRPQVLGASTDLLVRFCQNAVRAVGRQATPQDAQALQAQLRAYALGYACHLAGATVSAPYVQMMRAELGSVTMPPLRSPSVEAVHAALEEQAARQVFGRDSARGADWNGWLPAADSVPLALFDALSDAGHEVHGVNGRPAGSKAFDDRLATQAPPALSKELLHDAYGAWRFSTERSHAWTFGDWLLALLPMFIPPALMLPFAVFLPHGSALRRDDSFFAGKPPAQQRDTERALFEVMTFPLAATALVPLVTSIVMMMGSYRGAETQALLGLLAGMLWVFAAIFFFATLGDARVPAGLRWTLCFALPLALEIVHIVVTLLQDAPAERRWLLAMSSLSHIAIALVFVLCFVGFLHLGVEGAVDDGAGSPPFWVMAVLWLFLVMAMWLAAAGLLNMIPGSVRSRGFVRLVDDAALGTGPVPAGQTATLANRLLPAQRRPLFKLTWSGPGTLYIRPGRHALEFSFDDSGQGVRQVVPAPLAPMLASEFATLLGKAVRNEDNSFAGALKVERFATDDPLDEPLPAGVVFADHGDGEPTFEAHDAAARLFRPLPAEGGEPYVLYLAPPAEVAVWAGAGGTVQPLTDGAAVDGPGSLDALAAPGTTLTGNADTRFLQTFVPGDVIELRGDGSPRRVVTAVQDDQHLSLNLAVPAFAASRAYGRTERQRDADLDGPGQVANDASTFRQVQGSGTRFGEHFMVGDRIMALPGGGAEPETREVTAVLSDTLMTIDQPFSLAVPRGGVDYRRLGREARQGLSFAPPGPTALADGASVMDRAADLGVLLCLGTASHLMTAQESAARTAGPDDEQHAALGTAWQVLRNWNLDQRRVNEWRMLVSGNAVSEKRGQPDRADPLQPAVPADFRSPTPGGEPVANRLGWTQSFKQWLDMAAQPGNDSHADTAPRAGATANVELSRAVAFLLDLPAPTA